MININIPHHLFTKEDVGEEEINLEDGLKTPHWYIQEKLVVPKQQNLVYSREVIFFYIYLPLSLYLVRDGSYCAGIACTLDGDYRGVNIKNPPLRFFAAKIFKRSFIFHKIWSNFKRSFIIHKI